MLTGEVFGKRIKELRQKKGLSTRQLAEMMYVSQPTITRWETGERMPDIGMIASLAKCLDVEVSVLIESIEPQDSTLQKIIIVDDERIILSGELIVLREILPGVSITGFTRPSEALEFSKNNNVQLAFLDIELGTRSGLELCRDLLSVSPRMNVIFLTAYREYSLDAWATGASGFLLKPISKDDLFYQLKNLRYPLKGIDLP